MKRTLAITLAALAAATMLTGCSEAQQPVAQPAAQPTTATAAPAPTSVTEATAPTATGKASPAAKIAGSDLNRFSRQIYNNCIDKGVASTKECRSFAKNLTSVGINSWDEYNLYMAWVGETAAETTNLSFRDFTKQYPTTAAYRDAQAAKEAAEAENAPEGDVGADDIDADEEMNGELVWDE